VMVPADNRGIDETLDKVWLVLDEVATRFDQGRVAVESVVGEQEDLGLGSDLFFDRIGLRSYVALHDTFRIGEEWLRIEGIGLYPIFLESVVALEPLEIGRHPFF